MRLQKFLSAAGVCSRRKGEEYISRGLVTVNEKVVDTPGTKVDTSKDVVRFRGAQVKLKKNDVYIALNKPPGYISSCSHGKEKIVLDLIDIPERIFPVGRLDKDSEGLILMTSDGALHNKLSHPSFDHEKEYLVKVKSVIKKSSLQRMEKGIKLEEAVTRRCRIKQLSEKSFSITLKEGRNRQIRRMVAAVGNEVVLLKRLRVSTIKLNNLAKGSWRYLTQKEILSLKQD